MKKSVMNGFSLIEVVVTVAIIGILATIAYPSYTRFVAETRRSDATIALTQLAAQQEKFFTQCGGYADTIGAAQGCPAVQGGPGGVIAANTVELNPGGTTRDGYYNIVITPAPAGTIANSFLLTAAPVATSSQFAADNLKCATITITNTGAKGASGTDNGPNGGKCWKK